MRIKRVRRIGGWRETLEMALLCISLLVLAGCTHRPASPTASSAPTAAVTAAASPAALAASTTTHGVQSAPPPAGAGAAPTVPVKPLRISPEDGPVGTTFTVSGSGLPAGKDVTFAWATVDGKYDTQVTPDDVQFVSYAYTARSIPLGHAAVDAQGNVRAAFKAPEDYGEIHDVSAVVDGQKVAQGGFRLMLSARLAPTSGPVGTPITLHLTGIPYEGFQNTLTLSYDNHLAGFVTAVTTHGTATVQIRAAGGVGSHVVELNDAAHAEPYLNLPQSPVASFPMDFHWTFRITSDAALPPDTLEWPNPDRLARLSHGAAHPVSTSHAATAGIAASLSPSSGPVRSAATLHATGLPPGMKVEIVWISATGNRVSPTGWTLTRQALPAGASPTTGASGERAGSRASDAGADAATVGPAGSLKTSLRIPDDLGGWHSVEIIAADQQKVLAAVPYYVDRSLVEVTPRHVEPGQTFTVHLKGIGWTELDNGVAVTYDNSYVGFACGFSSHGDVTMHLVATGQPGVHLIDIYPMIYQGHGKPPWSYQLPMLTALRDGPGLALGYALPIYRLSIAVGP